MNYDFFPTSLIVLNPIQDRAAAEAVPQHTVPFSFRWTATFYKFRASSHHQKTHG